MNDDSKIITQYIAVWGWHLLAFIWIAASIIIFALPNSTTSIVLCFSALGLGAFCEVISYRRRKEIGQEEQQREEEEEEKGQEDKQEVRHE